MKKIYFAPETKLVKFKVKNKLMAGSLQTVRDENVTDENDLLSRENSFIKHSSVWDE